MVVPAWCGLDTLSFFFEISGHWEFKAKNTKNKWQTTPLTHAAGLVFAQHKTPLSRLVDLVKYELAEGVKNQLKPKLNELVNGFDYLVLESIDYPTESLHRFRRKVFGNTLTQQHCPLKAPHRAMLSDLNETLALAAPEPVTRLQLESALWQGGAPDSDALRTHIYRLRQKIDKPFSKLLILTQHAKGYRLAIPQ